MAVDTDFGMEKGELKQMLAKSKKEPVNCAVGRGGKTAYLRLDKIKQPKKIEAELGKDFVDMKDGRWGTAVVDTEVDPKLVVFHINKPAQGLGKRLVKILKQVGYSKVRFEFEDGSPAEEERDEEDVAGLDVAGDSAPLPSAATLKPRLTALVQRFPEVFPSLDATGKARLMDLAKQGQALIAADDYAGALHAIEDIEVALEAPVVKQEAVSTNTGAAAYGKARLAWVAVHKQTIASLEKLRGAVLETYKDSPALGEIRTSYVDRVEKKFEGLDDSLADLLDEATNATDPDQRAAKVQAAKDQIARYREIVTAEKSLLDEIDGNPFVPLSIGPVLTKTLDTLAAAVR